MTPLEQDVRAAVYRWLRDTGAAPSADELAAAVGSSRQATVAALQALAAAHALVLHDDGESIWMAHPFSAVPTDCAVSAGSHLWFANCVWDGLSIVALAGGTGRLETRSPAGGAAIAFDVRDGTVGGEAIVHFLVPASRFWDDIGFT